ncbi:ABC transporter permease [Yoonia vestfoldensis]|uniref:Oligopeptide transport system permease protein OppC n=1 Tax=Yoonia vestfoldensis TaxID=245188 RepID=A0A1Y0EBW1_9RHOB|nr:ABC transporter permease [Yoonia vestfoldensis]ARU00861.1 oligopeptide transport system permease protein OppC [Yoonia vestfoldensis]
MMGSFRHSLPGRLLAEPMAVFAMIIIVALILVALCADVISPHDYSAMNLADRFAPPSSRYWLGTDNLGRDTFSRLAQGSRIALYVALVAVSISSVIGLTLGMIAGFGPRWLDNMLLFVFDTLRAYPTIILALALAALLPRGLSTVIIVVVITSFSEYARVVRTQTLTLKNAEFILAEHAMGASSARIIFHHVLPNVLGPFFILAAMNLPVVITIEAGMSFLGIGVPPGTPSWGATLKDGFDFIRTTPWIIVAGGLPVILVTLGFTFLGEALRDQLDPKLRKSR